MIIYADLIIRRIKKVYGNYKMKSILKFTAILSIICIMCITSLNAEDRSLTRTMKRLVGVWTLESETDTVVVNILANGEAVVYDICSIYSGKYVLENTNSKLVKKTRKGKRRIRKSSFNLGFKGLQKEKSELAECLGMSTFLSEAAFGGKILKGRALKRNNGTLLLKTEDSRYKFIKSEASIF